MKAKAAAKGTGKTTARVCAEARARCSKLTRVEREKLQEKARLLIEGGRRAVDGAPKVVRKGKRLEVEFRDDEQRRRALNLFDDIQQRALSPWGPLMEMPLALVLWATDGHNHMVRTCAVWGDWEERALAGLRPGLVVWLKEPPKKTRAMVLKVLKASKGRELFTVERA